MGFLPWLQANKEGVFPACEWSWDQESSIFFNGRLGISDRHKWLKGKNGWNEKWWIRETKM
ncbi:uncharacterized protein G2W53_034201 [Senna tora]|uniref:Uncharacterized protein n=1 Tax=Senna tora TaxID=362788 RepID=A0A834T225_9FABA|nr:uncharacterized protein G2W53_034201 [Senna tora]